MSKWLVPLVSALFVVLAVGCSAGRTGAIALVDCTLIDGTGAPAVANAVVLIKDGKILAAGAADVAGSTEGYTRVDLKGAYVLPGFINAHVHSLYDEANFKRWLSAGVTTVRDVGFSDAPGYLSHRDAINRGASNARLISATPMITRAGGYGTVYVTDAESARRMVDKYVKMGVDIVKIAIEDDLQGRTWPLLSAEEVRAIVTEAHAAGKWVAAHVSHVRNLQVALDAGVDDIAHMVVEPLAPEMARAIAAKGIMWVPTLELWKGVSEKHSLDWDKVAIANTGVFFKAGGKIALGTDFNGYTTPFDKGFPITEARLLLEAGLSPMDVIVAGTRNAAKVCSREAELGTVEKGKIADLLVVAKNPLEDVAALLDVVQVYKAGQRVKQ
jgi:imidazolonepropionase-like amidohydrolase